MGAAARVVGVCVVAALAAAGARADDKEPVYDGKNLAQWVDIVQNDKSARQRALAVQALGHLWVLDSKSDALAHVATRLRVDPSTAVRAQAAIVLGGLREGDMKQYAAPSLIDALKEEKESRVRKQIIAAMTKFPAVCAAGIAAFPPSLKDPDPAVRAAAAEALALAGPLAKSAAADLAPLLKDSDAAVRTAAVYALGRIAPEGAAAVAVQMAAMLGAEKDLAIKRELITSLGLLGEKSAPVVKALTAALDAKGGGRGAPPRCAGARAVRPRRGPGRARAVRGGHDRREEGHPRGRGAGVRLRTRPDRREGAAGRPPPAAGPGQRAGLRGAARPHRRDRRARLRAPRRRSEVGRQGREGRGDEDGRRAAAAPGRPAGEGARGGRIALRKIETKPEPKKEPDPKKEP